MDFVNKTGLNAHWTVGFQPDGRELLVVAIKATFSIPTRNEEALLAQEQVPLTEADAFTAEPGLSAPLYESDFAHHKPQCDVLLNGTAHAPEGKLAPTVDVALHVGGWSKRFRVVGHRKWRKRLLSGIQPGAPEPFRSLPLSYDCAFGGVDDSQQPHGQLETYLPNPIGRGYRLHPEDIEQVSLPNTEQAHDAVLRPDGAYTPMAFGSVGRNWHPRYLFAGTYDQHWMDHDMPFFPKDFDARYFQAAPGDQQIPCPSGGEEVILLNLTPEGVTRFRLPRLPMRVAFIPYQGDIHQLEARADTLLLEPDRGRFMVTWRASLAMKADCFEMRQVIVGGVSRGWLRARETGKRYYPSLDALIRARRPRGKE